MKASVTAARQAAAAGPAKTARRAPAPEVATDPTGLLGLQRHAGNRAVRALLDGASGGDNRVAHLRERTPRAARIRLRTPPRSQAKLVIRPVDDELEQEADRVADAVMPGDPVGRYADSSASAQAAAPTATTRAPACSALASPPLPHSKSQLYTPAIGVRKR